MKIIWRKMVHFGTYWSILEKMTKVNDEVKPEDTTIEDMYNLSSPLEEHLLRYFGGNFKFKVETRLTSLTNTNCLLA